MRTIKHYLIVNPRTGECRLRQTASLTSYEVAFPLVISLPEPMTRQGPPIQLTLPMFSLPAVEPQEIILGDEVVEAPKHA